MKGIAVWIWIIGSLILGMMVFTMGSTLFFNQLEIRLKQSATDNFDDLASKISRTCIEGGFGEVYYYKNFAVPETVRAVYSSNDKDEMPPDKVSLYITDGLSAVGNYFCINYFGDDLPRCKPMSCSIDATYMGAPSEKPNIVGIVARLASEGSAYKTYNYQILINKSNTNTVTVTATPLLER